VVVHHLRGVFSRIGAGTVRSSWRVARCRDTRQTRKKSACTSRWSSRAGELAPIHHHRLSDRS
jgi:hypothetical protein